MKNLSNVIIIDDVLAEIDALRDEFIKGGCVPLILDVNNAIPTYQELPFIPRIICSDIKIIAGASDEQNYRQIADIISTLVLTNTVYVFIAWTSNPTEFEKLKTYLENSEELNQKQPIQFLCLDKNNFTVNILNSKIQEIDKDVYSLFYWKRLVSQAAEQTLDNLYVLSKYAQDTTIGTILNSLAQVSVGEDHIHGNEPKIIIEQLHYLLADTCNQTILSNSSSNTIFSSAIHGARSINGDLKPVLNTMLIIDTSKNNSRFVFPGDFRRINSWKFVKLFLQNNPVLKDKIGLFFKSAKLRKQELLYGYLVKKTDAQMQKIDNIINKVIFGVIDITAGCDFANGKEGLHKIVFSFLMPKVDGLKIKTSGSIISKEISLDDNKYTLIIDAKYLSGITARDITKNTSHLFRIREMSINDVRQKVLFYNARIGTSTF